MALTAIDGSNSLLKGSSATEVVVRVKWTRDGESEVLSSAEDRAR